VQLVIGHSSPKKELLMGFLSDSRDRAKATLLIKELTSNLVIECQQTLQIVEDELAVKKKRKYKNVEKFFIAISPELSDIKNLVFRGNVLDSASRLILEKGSPSMKGMIIEAIHEVDISRDLVTNKAMEIEDWMLETELISYNADEMLEHPYATEIIWIDVNDWSADQHYFMNLIRLQTSSFLK